MVGRRISKGCLSCRKRRIKCDGAQPSCRNCITSKFDCDGYADDIWHHSHSVKNQSQQRPDLGILAFKAHSQTVSVQLSRSDDTYIAYIDNAFYIKGTPAWVGMQAGEARVGVSYDCLLALALSYFGQAHNASEIRIRGRALYAQSLVRVRAKLSQEDWKYSADLLLAITVLYAFEMVTLTSTSGWINHALGLSKLMEIQGPSFYTNEPAHSVLVANRFNIILASLATSKPTTLSSPNWKMIPWQKQKLKDSMQLLLDVLADLPDLRFDVQRGCDPDAIRQKAMDILRCLRLWRVHWDTQPERRVTRQEDNTLDSAQSPCQGISLSYANLVQADEICLFNAGTIQTITIIRDMELVSNADFVLHPDLSQTLRDAATEICQSVKYQLSHAAPTILGPLMLLYPLRMAFLAFDKYSTQEGRWVADVVVTVSGAQRSWAVAKQAIEFVVDSAASEGDNC